MLNEIIITTLFRGVPEAFIHMYAMYAFANKPINKRLYIQKSIILAVLMVLISKLPISYGVHSILIVMAIIGFGIMDRQLEIVYCTSVTIINMIIQFLAEGLNVVFIEKILNRKLVDVLARPLGKVLYGSPSLVIFFFIVWIIGRYLKKRHKERTYEYPDSV